MLFLTTRRNFSSPIPLNQAPKYYKLIMIDVLYRICEKTGQKKRCSFSYRIFLTTDKKYERFHFQVSKRTHKLFSRHHLDVVHFSIFTKSCLCRSISGVTILALIRYSYRRNRMVIERSEK